jgi:hypothetical protein
MFLNVVQVSLICGGVGSQMVSLLTAITVGAVITNRVATAVSAVHILGFAAGYCVPKFGFLRDLSDDLH